MIPIIAIVGRQNVGKSTLFNRLTHTNDALVANVSGLTRDRKYGRGKWNNYEFIVVDTGSLDSEVVTTCCIAEPSLMAIEEANIILFIVDSQVGLVSADLSIAEYLRKREKTTVIVANKTDSTDIETYRDRVIAVSDFYALGMVDIVPIAASHGRGINHLINTCFSKLLILDCLPETSEPFKEPLLPIKIAVVGRPNVGKSTFINRILGKERVVVADIPDTTRDSIYIPMERNGREYILIDTAGIRKRSKLTDTDTVKKITVIKTLQSIKNANVVVLIIDALNGISAQDLSLMGFILKTGSSLVIAVNKCDLLSKQEKNTIQKTLDMRLKFTAFVRVHFISALHGNKLNELFKSVYESYQCATNRISTSLLNQLLHIAVDNCPPPIVRGRRIKLKYAHIGGYNPPVIVIHGTQVKNLSDTYKRYLINYFRSSLHIIGTPIHLQLKEGNNPFTGRRNTLNTTQIRKRLRLINYNKKLKEKY
ncbi:ribosome biogenesis GTPase Der [Candidatus Hoaglandella endobia]|uniref:GTPase Der n=1 Tax=Candidatus Hoaglandella endobia TaxID=1778263 RepID=A0A143WUZ1_9ENTR|nr:ribosome biogenesis GTPase Der [Candidatus Hoaglandella endobia]CUX97462.1 GTPase Der [Candidatus Hoaglandella endobia]